MASAAPRRNHRIDSVAIEQGADAIAVAGHETGGDVPIDVTNIVVILILAQIGEIQPETAKQSLVIAMKQPVQTTNHRPLQAAQDVLRAGITAYSVWLIAYGCWFFGFHLSIRHQLSAICARLA